MKVIFIIPFWYENNKTKMACSPFLIPQIKDISSLILNHQIIYLESGFGIKKIYNNYIKLYKLYNRLSKDEIIYSMYGSFHGFIIWLVLGRKFKIVNSFGGSDLLGSTNTGLFWKLRDFIVKRISLIVAKNVNHIVVKSKNLELILREKVSTPVSIIPNGVNLDIFKDLRDKKKLRDKFLFQKNEFIILFNSRRKNSKSESVKNLKLAEAVVSKLKNIIEHPVRLIFITDLSHSEINLIFNAADCLLLTSFHEGSPNIIKEAMATNLPIVSVDCGDVKERLINCENSYVSILYDESELAYYCKKVYQASKRSNGRKELIKQKLDNKSIAKKIVSIFTLLKNN